jgi:hypothetical protein
VVVSVHASNEFFTLVERDEVRDEETRLLYHSLVDRLALCSRGRAHRTGCGCWTLWTTPPFFFFCFRRHARFINLMKEVASLSACGRSTVGPRACRGTMAPRGRRDRANAHSLAWSGRVGRFCGWSQTMASTGTGIMKRTRTDEPRGVRVGRWSIGRSFRTTERVYPVTGARAFDL